MPLNWSMHSLIVYGCETLIYIQMYIYMLLFVHAVIMHDCVYKLYIRSNC